MGRCRKPDDDALRHLEEWAANHRRLSQRARTRPDWAETLILFACALCSFLPIML